MSDDDDDDIEKPRILYGITANGRRVLLERVSVSNKQVKALIDFIQDVYKNERKGSFWINGGIYNINGFIGFKFADASAPETFEPAVLSEVD